MRSLQSFVRRIDNARYHGGRRSPPDIDSIVMHATAGDTVDGAVSWMNRTLGNAEGKASYHYLIPKKEAEGIYRMCDPLVVAYHAGKSCVPGTRQWPGASLNKHSLGVAFANDNGSDSNPDDDALTDWQLEAGLWLCTTMCLRFGISPARVWGHREVSPGRKTDPLPRILDMGEWRAKVAGALA